MSGQNPSSFFEKRLPDFLRCDGQPALPEEVAVAFHIDGDGGGAWQVTRQEDPMIRIEPVGSGPVDCEVRMTSQDFMAIVEGRLSPQEAFLSGRVRVEGDVGLVLRLGELIQRKAA
jgi:putative sterol carrier protein